MDITGTQNSAALEIKLFAGHCQTYVYSTYKNSVANLRLSYYKTITVTEQDGFSLHTHTLLHVELQQKGKHM